jgi:S-disulfanyl-L-cysteine oxidoreductase SoxD
MSFPNYFRPRRCRGRLFAVATYPCEVLFQWIRAISVYTDAQKMRFMLPLSLVASLLAAVTLAAQAPVPAIWQGVYTAAQAERGKATFQTNCIRCHGGELEGNTAPALKGERFVTTWNGGPVSRLFEKIRDTMPPQFGTGILSDVAKIEIVAYILQTNGYPAGARELVPGTELAAIQILQKGEQPKVQNFSLVVAVGCLTRENDAWMLSRASEPVVTTENAPKPGALASGAAAPLGNGRIVLLSAGQFDPASQQGRKVEARGLIYQDPAESLLTVTSLQSVGSCER